jgi:outer membrane biosynthesis protein TonB
MWFWQRSAPEKVALWQKLLVVSVLVHSILLFALFFVYRGYAELHINASQASLTPAQVVLLPLHKVAPKSKQRPARTKREHKKKIVEQEILAVAAPKIKPKTALITRAAKPKKPRIQKKKSVPKPALQPPVPQPVIQEPAALPEPVKSEVEPEVIERPVAVQPAESVAAGDEKLYVGREELEALHLQQEIQQEIERHWKPPAGLASNITCQVRALVGWDGKVQEVKIEKGSGVLVFDVHARSVARAITFSKKAWGKEMVIHFGNQA